MCFLLSVCLLRLIINIITNVYVTFFSGFTKIINCKFGNIVYDDEMYQRNAIDIINFLSLSSKMIITTCAVIDLKYSYMYG